MITVNSDYLFGLNKESLEEIVKQTIPDWEEKDVFIDADLPKRIFLKINGEPHTILIQSVETIGEEVWHMPVTLCKDVEDEYGITHCETLSQADVVIGKGDFEVEFDEKWNDVSHV